LTRRTLEFYRANSKGKQRMARFVERIGIENFKAAVL
jgi:dissimilatory sulfite reductase (desulfoviridin) alpha/beta subunit